MPTDEDRRRLLAALDRTLDAFRELGRAYAPFSAPEMLLLATDTEFTRRFEALGALVLDAAAVIDGPPAERLAAYEAMRAKAGA